MGNTFSSNARAMTFIVTRDRAKSKAFYGEILGFSQTSEDDFAVVFNLAGTMLRISTVKDHQPAAHTVLGWEVLDIAASVDALMAKGVVFTLYPGFGQDARGIWTAPGSNAKVAWFLDPDGNNLSLTQFQTGFAALRRSAHPAIHQGAETQGGEQSDDPQRQGEHLRALDDFFLIHRPRS